MRKNIRSSNSAINYIHGKTKKANQRESGTRFYFMLNGDDRDRNQTFGVYDYKRKRYVLTPTANASKEVITEMEDLLGQE